MSWLKTVKELLGVTPAPSARHARSGVQGPKLEHLEERLAPYAATGNLWPNQQLITISFVPDGTIISTNGSQQIGSNLFATFDAKFGSAAAWQDVILKAAQSWAQQTNINFTVVPDDGAAIGSGNDMEGNPGFGDIRIGGYNFGSSVLGMTYYPPQADNYSIAGDVALNTGEPFNNGSTYDLYTVAAHEIGHALGLGESSVANATMYANYNGVKSSLASDDIAGIRNIYSNNNARTPDAFYSASTPNNSFANAANLNSYISTSTLAGVVQPVDLTTTSEVEYWTFTAPAATTGKLTVEVQSSGLSLLAPKMTVYAANENTVLGSASALGDYTGATLSVQVSSVTAGEHFYVVVQGTDNTQFSTGSYALIMNFGGGATPSAVSPNEQIPNGNPLHGSGGTAQNSTEIAYLCTVPVITSVSPGNSAGYTSSTHPTFSGLAPVLTTVQLYVTQNTASGSAYQFVGTALPVGNYWTFTDNSTPLSQGTYTFYATATPLLGLLGLGSPSAYSTAYLVTVITMPPNPPVISGFTPDNAASCVDYTNSNTPTLVGTAEANSTVTVYENGQSIGTTATSSSGKWSFTTNGLGNNSFTFTAIATDLAGNVSQLSAPLTLTVETQGVSQPQVQGITPDTGPHNNDGITNSPYIDILGKSDPNVTVQLFQNGQSIGTTQANASGNWTFNNTSTALAQGVYNFTASATNMAGTVSRVSNPFTVAVILTPPPAPVISSILETAGGGHQQFQITGTTLPNTTVTVAMNGSVLGRTNANGNGNWSYQYNPNAMIPIGTYVVSASISDVAGNVSSSSATIITADPSQPTISGFSPNTGPSGANLTNCNTPTLFGSAPAGTTVAVYENGQSMGTTTASNGTWNLTTNGLGNNSYAFTVTATDAGGNVSPVSPPLTITVNTQNVSQPQIQGITPDTGPHPNDGITSSPYIDILGKSDPNVTVQVFQNGVSIGTTQANASGNWTFNNTATALAQGTYSITASASNTFGTVSQLSNPFTVTIILTPPPAPVIAGVSETVNGGGQQQLVISGTTLPNTTVTVTWNGTALGTTNSNGNGIWSYQYNPNAVLPNGVYPITASIASIAGIVSTSTFNLLLGMAAPAAPTVSAASILSESASGTNIQTVAAPTLTGTAAAGSVVTVVDNGVVLGTAVANADGVWTFVCPTLAQGNQSISVFVTNSQGDESLLSAALNFQA